MAEREQERAPSRLEVSTARSSFVEEEYQLWRRYQVQVHGSTPDELARESYEHFLVETPLIEVEPGPGRTTPALGFGSFHQQYRVDGRLVAVGVVDVLPRCLSSKYLFWEPELAPLSLGKVTAMREIDFVREAQRVCPTLEYYYLGFYIHTCHKVRETFPLRAYSRKQPNPLTQPTYRLTPAPPNHPTPRR